MVEDKQSIFMQIIQRGIEEGIITLSEDKSKITYSCNRKYSTTFKNPEEKVRASYFVELVLDKKYPKENIDIEVKVERRIPDDRADIVVYDEDGKEYLVVECKKDGISDAEFKQAIEQAFGNANSKRAKYAIVVAGTTRTAFDVEKFTQREREKNVIADIPERYGKPQEFRFYKGDLKKDLKVVSRDDLIRVLDKAHDTVWQGGKLAPTTAFDEISKLLFCKLQEEKLSQITKKGEPYKFQIGTHETPEEVFKRVDKIYQYAKTKDAEVFKEDIKLNPKVVYTVVEHLQSINFNKTDLDTKGVAFERFMEDFFKGKMGQFFTPREIIQFAVKIMKIKGDEDVLDPACGSGGFLLNAMDYVRELADKEHGPDPEGKNIDHWNMWHGFAEKNLFGIEINDQIARVCKMNMIIHDDGHTNVISTDSLKDINEISEIHKGFGKNKFDVILTNPPFGAMVKSTEHTYLGKYKLGEDKKNQKTEILFIERCLEFLKYDGKMAIVLPDGILTNSSLQYVRDFLMEHAEIKAVVSLPQIAFSHFGAGVKSSLVFVRKKKKDEKLGNYPIFMAIAEHIGYDATGRKDPINDFDKILAEYEKFEKDKKGYGGC
jgi:type I restriction enzyme M protein